MSTGAKKDEGAEPKRRLHDIVAEELSIVDAPANQQKFLIVKRKDGMPVKTEKDDKSEGNGALVIPIGLKKAILPNLTAGFAKAMAFVKAVQAAGESDRFDGLGDLHKSELGSIKGLLIATSKQDVKDAELPALTMPALVKAKLLDVGTQFAEAVAKLAAVVMGAEDGEDAEGAKLPDAIAKAINGLTEAADFIAKTADELVSKQETKPADPVTPPAPTPPAPETKTETPPDTTATAKMKSFHTKLDMLSKMAVDAVSVMDEDTSAGPKDLPLKTSEGTGTSVGKLEPTTGSQDMDAIKLAQGLNTRDGYLAKSIDTLLAEVAKLNGKIDGVEKLAKSTSARVAEVSKARGSSSQIPVEGGTRRSPAEGKVSWPMDMNNDQTDPAKIDKAVSFYE